MVGRTIVSAAAPLVAGAGLGTGRGSCRRPRRRLVTAAVRLETERLLLRPLGGGDLEPLTRLHAEESFWWYPLRRGMTAAESEDFLERTLAHYEGDGYGVHAVVIRATGELAGWAGLAVPAFLPEILPAVEVGWRLGGAFRGRGYATEAGRAWVDHAFDDRGLDELVSICEPENQRSVAVMRRLGFTLALETENPAQHHPLWVMKLTRENR